MSQSAAMSPSLRAQELAGRKTQLSGFEQLGCQLDMSRGKPGREQLDSVSDILTVLDSGEQCCLAGQDARNYGQLAGLPCAREYWADMLGCRPEQTIVGGNASLNLMYDVLARGCLFGLPHSPRPWCQEAEKKFLCPAPGYDRHFRITEQLGFSLIPMNHVGPNMDAVEEAVRDPSVKGIWCVPKYSNPQGYVYSDETCRRIAALRPAAPDFTVMWDNAYCVHEFEGDFLPFPDILSLCADAGNADMVYEFASTSKITLPGAGISVLAASEENIRYHLGLMGVQTISYDKVNQLRHVLYLKDRAHTLARMRRHAEILAPKFRLVLEKLDEQLAPYGIARWNRPKGGYFVCVEAMPGTAKRALALCAGAGVKLTEAGATYPYGLDPNDSMIRIAPSLPPLEELEQAMDIFCTCLRIAALEKLGSI